MTGQNTIARKQVRTCKHIHKHTRTCTHKHTHTHTSKEFLVLFHAALLPVDASLTFVNASPNVASAHLSGELALSCLSLAEEYLNLSMLFYIALDITFEPYLETHSADDSL